MGRDRYTSVRTMISLYRRIEFEAAHLENETSFTRSLVFVRVACDCDKLMAGE